MNLAKAVFGPTANSGTIGKSHKVQLIRLDLLLTCTVVAAIVGFACSYTHPHPQRFQGGHWAAMHMRSNLDRVACFHSQVIALWIARLIGRY